MGEKWPKSWCRNPPNHTYTPPLGMPHGERTATQFVAGPFTNHEQLPLQVLTIHSICRADEKHLGDRLGGPS